MKNLKKLAVLSFVFTANLFSVEHEVKSTSFQKDLEHYAEHDYKAENEVFKFLKEQKLIEQSLYDYFLEHTHFDDSDHEDQMPNFDEVIQGAHDLITEKIKDRFMQGMTQALQQHKKLNEIQDPVFQFVMSHQEYDFIKYLMPEWLQEWAMLKNNENGVERINFLMTVPFDRGDILQILIDAHATLNIQDNNNYKLQALMIAAHAGNNSIIKILRKAGADKNIENIDAILLMLAAQNGREETVRMLINEGVDINFKDENHFTALMFAAQAGHQGVVKILLDAGADKNIKNIKNKTALDFAVMAGNTKVKWMLVDNKQG